MHNWPARTTPHWLMVALRFHWDLRPALDLRATRYESGHRTVPAVHLVLTADIAKQASMCVHVLRRLVCGVNWSTQPAHTCAEVDQAKPFCSSSASVTRDQLGKHYRGLEAAWVLLFYRLLPQITGGRRTLNLRNKGKCIANVLHFYA